MPKAKTAVLKALRVGDELAEAYATLGKLRMDGDWYRDGSDQEFSRGFEPKPDRATAHLLIEHLPRCNGSV